MHKILMVCMFSLLVWSAVQGPLWYCVCIINSYSTLLNWPNVSLLILFILFSNVFVFWYMTILYALLILLVAVLVTTITSLYDLTI